MTRPFILGIDDPSIVEDGPGEISTGSQTRAVDAVVERTPAQSVSNFLPSPC